MLYTTSENHEYRPGAGPGATILDYPERRVGVRAADVAGDRIVDFRFGDGSDWRPHSDWTANYAGWHTDESGEQPGTVDGYRIERISPEQSQIRDRTPGAVTDGD